MAKFVPEYTCYFVIFTKTNEMFSVAEFYHGKHFFCSILISRYSTDFNASTMSIRLIFRFIRSMTRIVIAIVIPMEYR